MNISSRSLLAASACAVLAFAPEAHAQFDTILDLPADGNIGGSVTIGTPGSDHTQVNVGAGGAIGFFATLTSGSEINLNGVDIGPGFTAQSGSTVNIISGSLGIGGGNPNVFEAGSVTIIGGGTFGIIDFFGDATITGGSFDSTPPDFHAGSVTTIDDGNFNFTELQAFAGSTLTINGGTFAKNSEFAGALTINGGTFGSAGGLTATFSGNTTIHNGTFGDVDTAAGSTTIINDGTFGNGFDHGGGSLTVHGGTWGTSADFFDDTTITGGTFGHATDFGGTVAEGNGTVDVTGGIFLGDHDINSGVANISGGSFQSQLTNSDGWEFELFADGTLNLTGTEFMLDGVSLGVGTHNITDRNVILDGLLLDGSEFKVALTSGVQNHFDGLDYFDENATLTVTVVPEPGSLALLGLGGLALVRRRRR